MRRRIRVIPMTIGLRYFSVLVVDDQFSSLVLSDFTRDINSLRFGIDMCGSAISTAFLDVPAAT